MSWLDKIASRAGVERDWNTGVSSSTQTSAPADDSAWKYISAGDIKGLADYTNREYNYHSIPYLGQVIGHTANNATMGLANLAQFLGAESVGNYLYEKGKEEEAQLPDYRTPELSLSYALDPNGLLSAGAMMAGSMLSMAPVAALAPVGGIAAGAARLAGNIPKVGGLLSNFAPGAVRWATTGPIEAMMEGGGTEREMLENGASREAANAAAWDVFKKNAALLTATNALEGGLLGKLGVKTPTFKNPVANGISRAAAYAPQTAAEAVLQGYEEGAQEGIQAAAMGNGANTAAQILNPSNWTEGQWDAAKMGFAGGLPLVGGMAIARRLGNRVSRPSSDAPMKSSGDENIDALIAQAAEKYGVPVNLLHSIAQTESGYNQGAKSEAGAIGMMQLMPDTAAGLGVDPNDLAGNIEGGAKYLREMLDTFDDDVEKAVAAYNAGPNAVKQHGGIPPFEETQDYVRKVMGGLDGYDASVPQRVRSLIEDATPFLGVTMDNGENGCVEAVTKIGAKSCPFLAQELSNGVVNVDRLVADAGNNVIPFDPNQLEEGDVIVYGDESDPQRHVVLYDGKGGYIGNSTEQNKVVQGADYNAMGTWAPTKIIKTGAQFGGAHSAAPVMPDFTGLIADDTNIKETQEAIQKLIDTDTMTPEQHAAILQAAEMARDTPIGSGTNPAAEAESVNEWQRLIDRKDAKGIFEKDPKGIVQHLQRLEKTQKMQRTRAAIENQQQIEATKQALATVQQAQNAQNAQAVPTQGDASVQQIVPEQTTQPMMDGQVSPTIPQTGDMQGANAAQMSAPIQPENVMQNPQMMQGTDGQIAPQNILAQNTHAENVFDAPVPQNVENSAVPTPSETLAAGIAQGTADVQPMSQPMETQTNIDNVQQAILQREVPLLSIPAYVQARQSGDLNTAAQIAQQAGVNDVAQLYGMLLTHRNGQAANATPYAPQQNTPQAAVPVKAPVPIVGVRPNVPAKLPDNLGARRALGISLNKFMTDNKLQFAQNGRLDLVAGRGQAIRAADKKITAWEKNRAEQEAKAAQSGAVNTGQAAQEGAQGTQNDAHDRMLAQRGMDAQNGAKTVRGKSAQNWGNKKAADKGGVSEGASVSTEPESLNEPSASPSIHAPSSTSTIPSEAEESKEKALSDNEREAVKGLSADAKNVYQMVRDKLSSMKNKKVSRAASAGAVLLARHADIIARKVRATLGTPFTAMDYYRTWFDLQYGGGKDADGNVYAQRRAEMSDAERKEMQFRIIEETNPMHDDIHTGIRSVDDILTAKEAFETKVDEDSYAYPDFTEADGKAALKNGEATIYSSYPIAPGVFVTPSKMQAQDYAGGGKVYSKKVSVKDVAWIHSDEGQYAPIETESFNQSAWHGSPYDFDGFDLGAIGTGEGAQVHGWGLYTAQDRAVSEEYKEHLKENHKTLYTMMYDGKPIADAPPEVQQALQALEYNAHDVERMGAAAVIARERKWHVRDKENWDGIVAEFDRPLALYEENPKVSVRELRASVPKHSNAGMTIDAAKPSEKGKRRTAADVVRALNMYRVLFVGYARKEDVAIRALDSVDPEKVHLDVKRPVGKLYHVEIPDNDVLLNEQKPFDEQSKFVQEKLAELYGKESTEEYLNRIFENPYNDPALRIKFVTFKSVKRNIEQDAENAALLRDVLDRTKSPKERTSIFRDLDVYSSINPDHLVYTHSDNLQNIEASRPYLEKMLAYFEEHQRKQERLYAETLETLRGVTNPVAVLHGMNGRAIYTDLSRKCGGDKAASLALNEVGIKGITYVGGRDGRCFVVFDDKAISIIEKFNQQMNEIVKGTTQDVRDGQRIVSLFEEADESTFLHEMGHLFLLDLERLADMSPTSAQELQTVKKWAAWSEGQTEEYKGTPFAAEFAYIDARIRAAIKRGDEKKAEKLKRQWEHERFARGFEMYLKHGEAPTKGLRAVFAKFRAFLQRVYQAFTGTGGRATAEVEAVMARMISIEDSSDLSAYPQGKKTNVYTDSGKKIPVQYRIVSADDLITSHDAGALEINPGYPAALQPRDRERVMMREQVTRMANTLRPEDLADARNLNQGAPLIRNDGVVLNGNGRTIAIARAQARNKERAIAYRDYLVENAATFGFSKEDVEGIKNPVLVREVQGGISDGLMQDIIGSTTGGARMGASEAAQADAEKITYAMLDAYVPNEKGDLTTAANRNFVAGILHKIVGNGEMNAYLDKDGHPNADGIQRVKRALFARAYGDDELVAKMSESADDDIRNVSNGMMAAAPMMARLSVKKGVPYVKELQDAISDAVKQLETLRANGESVKDYLGAQALFAEHEDSAEMRAILSFLDGNKRSGKKIATFFSRIAETLDEMETPSGNELFGAEMPSLMDVLEVGRSFAVNGGQDNLFDEYIVKEANALYNEAAKKFPDITDKEVADHVREAIQLTLDFGQGNGEIKAVGRGTLGDKKLSSHRDVGHTDDYRSSSSLRKESEKELKRGKIYGLGITRKLVNDGAVSLVGQKAKSAADLAEIAQVLRHHGYEKFHYVYVDDAGNVKFHETVTARLPANAPIFLPEDVHQGKNSGEYLENAKRRIVDNMRRFGASKFYLIHNHPSGDPTPSREDFDVTSALVDLKNTTLTSSFGGHIILDHNKYAVIDGDMNSAQHVLKNQYKADYYFPEKAHPALGVNVESEDITQNIADMYGTEAETTAFYLTAKNVVRSVQKIHDNFKDVDEKTQMNYLRYCARSVGGLRVILVTNNKGLYDSIKDRINSGRDDGILDVVLMKDGRALYPEEKYRANKTPSWLGQEYRNVRVEQVLEKKTHYGSTPSASTVETLLQSSPALKKAALEYGAKDERGKVTFADETRKQEFLKIAQALLGAGERKFSKAWHGSPFDFDHFSLGSIGSGEGAQAHGWGLYFAKERETAENYRGELSDDTDIIFYYGERYENTSDGWMISSGNETGNTIEYDDPARLAFDAMSANSGDIAGAIQDLESEMDDMKEGLDEEELEELNEDEDFILLQDAVTFLRDNGEDITVGDPGRLFEVEIPDEDVLLDEDFSFDEQPPKVKAALRKLVKDYKRKASSEDDEFTPYKHGILNEILEGADGERVYEIVSSIAGSPERASRLLNKYGIRGISYDGQRDERCYVVFDDNAIDIIDKFSARRQESLKEMLDGIRLIPPTRVSPRKRVLVDWGCEMGVPVVFFKGDPSLHGFHQDGVTFLNVDSEITPQWTFWHEAMHWMKANNPDIYSDLVREIRGAEGFTKKQLDAYRREIGAPNMSNADVIEEMLADALPDVKRRIPLLRDIGKRDTGLIQRLVAWIHNVMRRFHDHFYTPKGGLTSLQRRAMVRAFGNLVLSIRDAEGKPIFRVGYEGARIILHDKSPLPDVKYSQSNKAMRWIAAHPFKYDESRTMDENIQRAECLAQEYLDTFGTTDQIDTPARQQLRKQIADKLYGKGAKKKEGKVWLVLGMPASGKSTISDPIMEREGALLIDSDEAKKMLPEFSNGLLAGAVHEESSDIATNVMERAITNHDNIVWPLVGKTRSSIDEKVQRFKEAGYEVNLVYVDLPIEKAIERTKARFRHTGRLVPPRYLQSVGLKPRQNYDKIKTEEGVDSYEAWNNDVARGELPIRTEYGSIHIEKARENQPHTRGMGRRGHSAVYRRQDVGAHRGKAQTDANDTVNNTTNRSDHRGGFSMPKFSANTQEDRKGNFKWLTGAIRSFVGVAPADNLELPGRPTREQILSPKELERRIKERWIQQKNIISQEKQPDGKIKVTYYPDTHDVGYVDWIKSVRQVAKRNPFVKILYDLAHKAMKKQEHLRNEFGKALKELGELVKNEEDLKTLAKILWLGDAKGKVFTDAELRAEGASENAIKAYRLVRRELEKAYKMLRDAQTQVKTRSQTLEPQSVESFKKNHWIEDSDVISAVPRADGTVLLTWRGGRTYDVKGKTITAEELKLMQEDENINVTSATPIQPTLDDFRAHAGGGLYKVNYVERIKPIFRRTGYMPHFFHEWMIYEKYKDPQTGEVRYTSVASGRTMNEAVKVGNEIAAKNKDKQYVLRPKGFDLGAENSVVIGDMDFAQMSRKLAESTEISLADARSLLLEDAGMSLKSRHRFFGSLLERKDGKGFDQDVQWVLAHYLNSAARYVAMEEFKPAAISMYERFFGAFDRKPPNLTAKYCQDLINDVNGNPRGVEVWLNDLIKKTWLGKHVADSYGDRVALAINGELSTWNAITKLGLLNVASAAVNFSQFINVGAALNDYGYAAKGLRRALNPSALDEKIIEASGLLDDINMADDNGGYTQRRGGKVRGIYSGVKKVGEKSLFLFQKADTLMRKAAVLGAYYQGVEQKGMRTAPGDELSAEALDYAQEINDDANFDYSSANAPNMLRAGSVVTQQLFQFQKYPIMQFEFMYNILKNGTRGQKVRMFVPYVLFCGIGASIPFGSLFNQLFSFLFGLATGDDEDIAQDIKAEVLRWAGKDPVKKAIAETALYGVLAPTFGLDISGRIGMSNAFAGEFYGEKPDSISGIVGQQLGGPMAVSAINMLRQAHEGNPIEALKALSPALGNMAQAWVGESRTTRHRVNARYDTAYDKIAHALGFRSVDESKNAFIMNYEYEQKSKQNRTKQEAIQDYLDDPSDANRRTINALGITNKQIREARIQQERTALERATEGRPNTSRKHGASRKRKEEAKRETLYDILDDE